MASPANNNSSSSPPIPSRPNPKPRNSEAGDPFRRSFGGNPFPVNSKVNIPSDFSRRNSLGGRVNSRVEFSDKENDETKALPTPKGSKNFMSPTISAVSKINPSPRKRVLSDRNQVSRSLSDITLEDTNHQAKSCVSFERSHDMTVTDFDHEDKGIVYSDPRFRISPRPSVPYTSPEFADGPLLPPYDHKKNYLSPRPQFLHYRPNLRIEKQLDERKKLEELFISDSCEKQEETEDVEQLEAESDEETSQVPKQSGFGKYKFLGWFLALAMAYMLISATFSPLLKESHISREVTEFAKGNSFDKLSEKLWTLTKSSLVYIDELISRLRGRAEEYGPLQFHNLTYILEGYTVFEPTSVEIIEEPLQEKTRGGNNLEDSEEESRGEENSEVSGETNDGDAESKEFDEETEMKPGTDIELNEGEGNLEVNNDAGGLEFQEKLETGSTRNDQEEEEAIYMNQQKESVLAADAESESEDNLTEIAAETSDDLHPKVRPFNKAMIVSSSTVLVLLAAVAFLFLKKAKHVAVAVSAPETEAAEVDDSFHKKSSFLSDNKDPKEYQSGGRNSKLRRESMASSASEYSVGSFSYGSFITYEKIPIKSGDREEKMVTPVRRSSRIRNHHQSSML